MSHEVIPKRKVAHHMHIIRSESMDLVGSIKSAFPEISSPCDPKLPLGFISHHFQFRCRLIERREGLNLNDDINNGLCRQAPDGGAPNVMNVIDDIPQTGQ